MSSQIAFARTAAPSAYSPYLPAIVWVSLLALGAIVQSAGSRVLTTEMVVGLCLTTALQIGAATAFFAILTRKASVRLCAFAALSVIVLVAPFAIPEEARTLRFITACASVIVVMKLWDLHTHVRTHGRVPSAAFFPYLCNAFSIVLRNQQDEAPPPREKVLRDLAWGLTGSVAGMIVALNLYRVPFGEYPLLVEHGIKAIIIFVSILAWARAAIAFVRLAGGAMRDFSNDPLRAVTPADFWRRYNRVFQQYFHENVFKRMGGRRHPAAVTVFIFLLSAAIHEYVFGIAIGRVQGFQTAFFLLQGIAVAATLRVRPRSGVAIIGWTTATIAFNLVTSILFFLSFHALAPLYVNELPALLQR